MMQTLWSVRIFASKVNCQIFLLRVANRFDGIATD
jgi:hypothetical protein